VQSGHSVIAAYSGDQNFAASSSSPLPQLSLSNAASFTNSANFAANEIATLMGAGLSVGTASGTLPLSTVLSGTNVTVTDVNGVARPAQLYFVSPTQINFVIPAGTAPGPATVTVTLASGPVYITAMTVKSVDPGLFFAPAGGQSIAQAVVFDQPQPSGAPQISYTASYNSSTQSWSAVPIVLNGTDKVYLELFGTGIQNAPPNSVTATVNGQSVPVTYAGWSQQYPGVDQVNIGPLPAALAGSGAVPIVITVSGQAANTVTVLFQ
jgi:uncharacterized protein (TIGR03437 family)